MTILTPEQEKAINEKQRAAEKAAKNAVNALFGFYIHGDPLDVELKREARRLIELLIEKYNPE